MKLLKIVTVSAMTCVTTGALAMASGSVVFDPANFSKNMLTAAATVATEVSSAETALRTLYQYKEMIRQAQRAATGDLHAIGALAGEPELARAINDAKGTYTTLKTLDTNLDNMTARVDYLAAMASRYGKTDRQYAANQAELNRENIRLIQVQREKALQSAEDVQKGYNAIQHLQNLDPDQRTALLMKLDQNMALANSVLVKTHYDQTLERVRVQGKEAEEEATKIAFRNDTEKKAELAAANADSYSKGFAQRMQSLVDSTPGRQ